MIDLTTKLIGEDGEIATYEKMHREEQEDGSMKNIRETREVTLYKILREALLAHNGDTDPEVIERRYDLFLEMKDKDEVEYSEEDRNYITGLMCKKFDVMFAGQVIKLLK